MGAACCKPESEGDGESGEGCASVDDFACMRCNSVQSAVAEGPTGRADYPRNADALGGARVKAWKRPRWKSDEPLTAEQLQARGLPALACAPRRGRRGAALQLRAPLCASALPASPAAHEG